MTTRRRLANGVRQGCTWVIMGCQYNRTMQHVIKTQCSDVEEASNTAEEHHALQVERYVSQLRFLNILPGTLYGAFKKL